MNFQILSPENLSDFTKLTLELWQECNLEEEMGFYGKLMHSENDACFLLSDGKESIGFIHVSILQNYVKGAENSPTSYLEGIFVKPKHRKKGLGKQLVLEAEHWARNKGIHQLASDTPISNTDSIEFHSKTGFREAERIVCFIKEL